MTTVDRDDAPGFTVPFDPSRPPWSGSTSLRADYRSALQAIDDDLITLARGVVDLASALPRDDERFDIPTSVELVQRGAAAVEDRVFSLVALESPVADELRELVAVTRAVHDVQRGAKLLTHVEEHAAVVDAWRDDELVRLHGLAVGILRDAVAAWESRDALAVNDLSSRDDVVDGLEDDLAARAAASSDGRRAAATALLARNLERLADHGVALAGHLSWAVTGDRHLAASRH